MSMDYGVMKPWERPRVTLQHCALPQFSFQWRFFVVDEVSMAHSITDQDFRPGCALIGRHVSHN